MNATETASALIAKTTPEISLPEFKAQFPDGRAWRAAGSPKFGLEAVAVELTAAGFVEGVDYDDWTDDYNVVKGFVAGCAK